jgi:hypothetical protein
MRHVVVLSFLILAAVVAAVAHAATAGPTGGSVTGSGAVAEGFSVSVGARGSLDGGDGALIQRVGGSTYTAKVDCVLVEGTSAMVVGTLLKPQGGETKLVAEFVDNGHGQHGTPDAVISGLAEGAQNCHPSLVDFSDAFPVTHGNFTVRAD